MTTLRRERRHKFEKVIRESGLYSIAEYGEESAGNYGIIDNEVNSLVEALLDAAESRSEREQSEPNVELMRGDWREYPERLWKIAEVLRDVWMFSLPEKPQKANKKSKYGAWIMMMDSLREACAEFGADVLVKVHADWRAGFKNGIAPYTVAQPSSLLNMASAKARELREQVVNQPTKPEGKGFYV